MSWKLGKKLKDGALGNRSPSFSTIDRSATPTPASIAGGAQQQPPQPSASTSSNPYNGNTALASSTGAPIARSGLLVIRVVDARGLSLPPGQNVPPMIARALAQAGPNGASMAGSLTHGNGSAGNRQSMQRKQCWWLPYLVLEFDKNEVLIDALGGDVSAPVWMYKANFDVSRNSEISLQCYLRSGEGPGQSAANKDGQGDDVMGMGDVYLGGVKFVPDFENQRTTDEWYPLSSGSGQVHIQVSYRSSEKGSSLNMDAFELLKVIGKGSFGKVMQVRKKDTSRIYALKTIRKAHIVSRSEVTHTLAERTVLAQVNNPFIVPLKFSFQSPDKLYLVLAFVNGGELFHHLQREGRFNEERSRFYAAELLCALEHLHGFNVVYRDLKPENILLDYTGHIALCDFGLCKLNMGDDETTNTFCGTPEYLAPELLLGHGYTKAVDWWTLGVLLYEMLTGLPPFYSEDVNEMYRKILQDPLRFGDEVSRDARSILILLLNRDPSKRLGTHGAADIKNHEFFSKHIDWNKLMAKKVQPPFKPAVASAVDTSNFDPEFTSEQPVDSVVDDSHMLSATVQEQFQGFSYTGNELGMEGTSFRG
ncbi:putative proliferation-associated serine/threonine protein kinase [Meira miltonrushii]|uniref:non-specific serine/threonine protein kinase n=1 Tax=Meira miltonrushii TaxID=1280837 RepID=A0A316VIU9_9BASI|nr:putative proliferation-associated serine/threonine protein kinase [Meira miltonrushii]PWN36988.1 putative proliferation-associated serine/threonine protein kinase [Meira miltonrushii]